MTRQYVFLVHGMGKQEKGNGQDPFVEAIVAAMRLYEPYAGMDRAEIEADHVCFKPICYDEVVDGYRRRWKGLTGSVVEQVTAESQEVGEVFAEVCGSAGGEGGLEDFFWTHVLGPLLWLVLKEARLAIMARVHEQVVDGLKEMYAAGDTNSAHVLAHSLGTSVAHDALVALRSWRDHEGGFDPRAHMWQTVGAIANVSRLLEARFRLDEHQHRDAFNVYRSVMKPGGAESICENFVNVHHTIDPFTWPRRFKPGDWPTYAYSDVEIERFRDVTEVHDLEHYFANPWVHIPLLRLITGRVALGTADEVTNAWNDFMDAYPNSTSEVFDGLRGLFGGDQDRKLSAVDTVKYLYETFKVLRGRPGSTPG